MYWALRPSQVNIDLNTSFVPWYWVDVSFLAIWISDEEQEMES